MKVNINGKEYPSIKSMCKDLKIDRPTVYKHMREKNARCKMPYIISYRTIGDLCKEYDVKRECLYVKAKNNNCSLTEVVFLIN